MQLGVDLPRIVVMESVEGQAVVPNSGMKPIGMSARNNSPGISNSAQLRTNLRLSLRDRLLPDKGLRG